MSDMMLDEKAFEFIWDNSLNKTEVKFKIPALNKSKSSVKCYWGPTYTFELSAHSPIEITYKDLKSNVEKVFSLDSKTLVLESPMLVDERRDLPLYYIVDHKEYGNKYFLYINDDFELNKVKVIRSCDKACLLNVDV